MITGNMTVGGAIGLFVKDLKYKSRKCNRLNKYYTVTSKKFSPKVVTLVLLHFKHKCVFSDIK